MTCPHCNSENIDQTDKMDLTTIDPAGFDEDLQSSRLDRLSLYELPIDAVYTTPTRDDAGKCLIQRG